MQKDNINQKWEYLGLYCTSFELYFNEEGKQLDFSGHILDTPIKLDPKLNTQPGKAYWKLAWSDTNNYWTNVFTALNELGENGWELVTSTPPWSASMSVNGIPNSFHLLLKRPKK